jgi:hypothetical protein
MAQGIADLVRDSVGQAHYSGPHIADVAHRAAFLASHHYLSVLEAEATGKPVAAGQALETAKRYDERRKAERAADMLSAIKAANAAQKRALRT